MDRLHGYSSEPQHQHGTLTEEFHCRESRGVAVDRFVENGAQVDAIEIESGATVDFG